MLLHSFDFNVEGCIHQLIYSDFKNIPRLCQFDESIDIGLKYNLSSALDIFMHCCLLAEDDYIWRHFD